MIIGVVALVTGVLLISRRHDVVARHERRLGGARQPPSTWIMLGGMMLLVGSMLLVSGLIGRY